VLIGFNTVAVRIAAFGQAEQGDVYTLLNRFRGVPLPKGADSVRPILIPQVLLATAAGILNRKCMSP
jgi:hypothetical protein